MKLFEIRCVAGKLYAWAETEVDARRMIAETWPDSLPLEDAFELFAADDQPLVFDDGLVNGIRPFKKIGRLLMTEPRKERCETCYFFEPWTATVESSGLCHKNAPVPILEALRNLAICQIVATDRKIDMRTQRWPEIKSDDWCGEWQAVE